MKKLDFTPKNVSIMNPRYRTQNSPTSILKLGYCTYQLTSLAFISGSIVLYVRIISVSVSDAV